MFSLMKITLRDLAGGPPDTRPNPFGTSRMLSAWRYGRDPKALQESTGFRVLNAVGQPLQTLLAAKQENH